jgi:predicted RNase H-like nuclease (RuvC/YqgF family)
VDDLKADLAEKDAALRGTSSKLDRLRDKTTREIKRDQEIKIRGKEIERLRALLRSERKYIKKLKKSLARQRNAEQIEELKGMRRLKPLEAFSKEAVALASERWGLENGDLVFLEDASGGGRNTADLLIAQGIEAVITDSDMSPAVREYFQESGIPVFSSKELPVQRIDGLPFVRPEDAVAARARWEEMRKAYLVERQAKKLESIFQEYRVERKKEEKRLQK